MTTRWAILTALLGACSGKSSDDAASDSASDDALTADTADDDDDTPGDDDDDDDGTPGDDDDHDCIDDPLSVDVGTGATAYEPLTPNANVTVVHGPQGGWHIDIGGEVSGGYELMTIAATVRRNDTKALIAGDATITSRQSLTGWTRESCTGQFYAFRAFVDISFSQQDVCDLAGQPLTIAVTVSDLEDAASTTTELVVTAALDPEDIAPCGG